jgi:hypothetical protein
MLLLSRKKFFIFKIIILSIIFFANCSKTVPVLKPQIAKQATKCIFANRDTLLMRGHSAHFADGYLDGCQSGQKAAGDNFSKYIKDEELAKISTDYITGWEQGHLFCYKHMLNLIKHSGSHDPAIYNSKEAIEKEKQRIWSELKK